jgi:hypothetical protein
MKNTIKFFGFAVLVAVIGFTMSACDELFGNNDDGDDATTPEITTASLPNGKKGAGYSQTLAAKGKSITWTRESGALPAGLTLAATGAITGTPTTVGTYTFYVKAANSNGNNFKSLTITIAGDWQGSTTRTITRTLEWLTAVEELYGQTGEYTLTIAGTFGVPGPNVSGSTNNFGPTADGSSLTVTLNGSGGLWLSRQTTMFRIGENQTLILDGENLTLEGLTNGKHAATQDNNAPVVYVSGGTFTMNKGKITGNTVSSGSFAGGVEVSSNNSIFTMNGGEISGNTSSSNGGGVYVSGNNSTFTMNGGKISGNELSGSSGGYGGGVYVSSGTFTMNAGEISGNKAFSGGGVNVQSGTFTMMEDGEISGNTASQQGGGVNLSNATFTMKGGGISGNTVGGGSSISFGGGVHIDSSTFTMEDGIISDNTAGYRGGGVFLSGSSSTGSTFTMKSGTISGNTASASNYSAGGVYVGSYTTFTMIDGTISGNTASSGGGVAVTLGTFQIVNGLIYGSDEADESLRNTTTGDGLNRGAALNKSSGNDTVAQRGTLGVNGTFVSKGNLTTQETTLKVSSGDIVP